MPNILNELEQMPQNLDKDKEPVIDYTIGIKLQGEKVSAIEQLKDEDTLTHREIEIIE